MERGHSEALIPLVQSVLEEAGLPFADLDMIVTPIGPGAFTGLRIGLSAAKSLGLSLDIPVIGLPSFDILAWQFFDKNALPPPYQKLGILMETKRSDFYVFVDKPEALAAEDVLAAYGALPTLWIGDAIGRFESSVSPPKNFGFQAGHDAIDPAAMIAMAQQRGQTQPPGDLSPLYLRGADVSVSTKAMRSMV